MSHLDVSVSWSPTYPPLWTASVTWPEPMWAAATTLEEALGLLGRALDYTPVPVPAIDWAETATPGTPPRPHRPHRLHRPIRHAAVPRDDKEHTPQ